MAASASPLPGTVADDHHQVGGPGEMTVWTLLIADVIRIIKFEYRVG